MIYKCSNWNIFFTTYQLTNTQESLTPKTITQFGVCYSGITELKSYRRIHQWVPLHPTPHTQLGRQVARRTPPPTTPPSHRNTWDGSKEENFWVSDLMVGSPFTPPPTPPRDRTIGKGDRADQQDFRTVQLTVSSTPTPLTAGRAHRGRHFECPPPFPPPTRAAWDLRQREKETHITHNPPPPFTHCSTGNLI